MAGGSVPQTKAYEHRVTPTLLEILWLFLSRSTMSSREPASDPGTTDNPTNASDEETSPTSASPETEEADNFLSTPLVPGDASHEPPSLHSPTPPQQHATSPTFNARDHTYLPGVSLALGSDDTTVSEATPGTPFSLVCWYTHDIVVLPGATLPLRLVDDPATQPAVHQRALQTLRRQIQASRSCPAAVPSVYLGIWSDIAVVEDASASSTTSSRGDDDRAIVRRPQGQGDDDNDQDHITFALRQQQRQQERHWRRQSWTRFGMGPIRLRRLSERVRQELSQSELQEIAAAVGDSSSSEGNGDDHEHAPDNDENGINDGNDRSASNNEAENDETGDDEANGQMDDDSTGDPNPTENNAPGNRTRRRIEHSPPPPNPWRGKIGTLLTVIFTHQLSDTPEYANGISRDWSSGQPDDDSSLILTTKAVGRFRIVDERAATIGSDPYAHARRRLTSGHLVELMVEEWPEKPLTVPRSPPLNNFSLPRRLDPSTQVHTLVNLIRSVPSLSGMMQAENFSTCSTADPIAFSYWVASNLPSLSLAQKLEIMEIPTATERFVYLQAVIEALQSAEAVLHCGNCAFPLARSRQVFTLGGAEGTAGAYVNPHGIVHETLTVRELDLLEDEADLWLLGGPEVKDSWFPGYAWTIANCALCGNHLGWRFDKVSTTARTEGDRPQQFFGLRAGQIQSRTPVTRSSFRFAHHP